MARPTTIAVGRTQNVLVYFFDEFKRTFAVATI
jgi:hypothetical protein